ncbi:glycosyltransferase [Flavivirga aquimarina]|uniref:Glycosyltransferase n=2 Tax=Flavivirga aquimarina TaxID=2027862 RepID=A0ABT8WBM7_9FLAO|nr:glycosyltransferase [Flavivirga aquimarina]
MRVLQLIDSLQIGGAERTAVNYANYLVNDIEASFICASRKEGPLKQEIKPGIGYLFLNRKKVLDFKAVNKLHSFIKKNQIDIVHAHSTSYFFASLLKLRNRNVSIIWHDHNGNRILVSKSKNRVLIYCSYFFSKIITVNNDLKNWAEINTHCKKVYYLSNFSVLKKEEKQVTHLKGEAGKRLICVANLRHPKNHIFLFQVFKEVSKLIDGWSLHLVGKDFDDAYSNELKGYIREHNLNNIFFYGQIKDIHYVLNQSDIGVLTSSSEGFPLTLLEYGLAKLPVIATNVGYCNHAIRNENEGTLVEVDIKEFSKALLNYINNYDLRKSHGSMLYRNIATNYNVEKNIKALISIYEE